MLEKNQSKSICPITISEVTYHIVARKLTIQFKDIFMKHCSPHEFGVTTHGGCEIMVHCV
jgi:hypothetical protein